ncbi:CMP-N-acetylneuraminic acid synthetase [Reichenbachiella faecimaris]|uniref:CMP-N-acetylneuraminic acid synthetase n=2 Tax=Reichenbachiella faecimaris TaxID=692418 RepID=A0A1W2GCH1_REIFA|nr:CMP-N-acetylneuraminic acid synthetase [Reichenbachiella faecimaris]
MIPARLGSQRLKKKNLQLLRGEPVIVHAIRKALVVECFDEVWVNSESDEIGQVAIATGAKFHKRPENLANNIATSEDFVYEFLLDHECDYVVQLHSIAPLVSTLDIENFVEEIKKNKADIFLSVEEIQIECAFNSQPVNFYLDRKTNSQELTPVQRIMWSISAWKRDNYIKAYELKKCATYTGKIKYFPLNKLASHVIKTQEDLDYAEALFDLANK